MITHLVDSDWVIDYLRGREEAVQLLQPVIRAGALATSLIVYAEIYEGLLPNPQREERLARLNDFLAGVPILGLDRETAEVFAELRSRLRRQGELLADHDTWIAAAALRYDLALVSRDSHFDRIPDLRRA